ncbi:hypothetical protein FUAX_03320 [Fulvitalea axinellae]|uniref:Uncharacterized protein n=1 Tax=Fulvitalea axinellae TaxID=1182444 RepID=A0AAU9DAP6_9BACT|nr:hypothetical protein FUAX_03320 [Fulvitalea axinellae]
MAQTDGPVSILSFVTPLDTALAEGSAYTYRINCLWNKDSVDLLWVNPEEYDRVQAKRIKNATDTAGLEGKRQFLFTTSQNCFSYALQKYFEHHRIDCSPLIDSLTKINSDAMSQILASSFKKRLSFHTKPARNLKTPLPDGSLVLFRYKNGRLQHAMFYSDGVIHSKNGMWPATEYRKLKEPFKKYWDAGTVEVYFHREIGV